MYKRLSIIKNIPRQHKYGAVFVWIVTFLLWSRYKKDFTESDCVAELLKMYKELT